MGQIIEEHTQQLEGLDRKEKLLIEREQELKKEREEMKVERERIRLASVVKVELDPKPSTQLREPVSIS